MSTSPPIGPVDGSVVPRFVGPATFARLPRSQDVDHVDIAVIGVPFDSGVSYRPGARFGPAAIREASRLIRPYNPAQSLAPFARCQVADAGDVVANPFDIVAALASVEQAASEVLASGARLLTLGGDHTIALALLRAAQKIHGPVALIHFDAHLDTWDTYFGADFTHGTPFRRAVEEELLVKEAMTHVGIRGPLYARTDLTDDAEMGFAIVTSDEVASLGVDVVVEGIRTRVSEHPVYVSIDIDVLDPAHAPGTGTPEAGGLTSRELLMILRGLASLNIIAADVVEVAPAYDHAEITAVAASHVAFELISSMAAKFG